MGWRNDRSVNSSNMQLSNVYTSIGLYFYQNRSNVSWASVGTGIYR